MNRGIASKAAELCAALPASQGEILFELGENLSTPGKASRPTEQCRGDEQKNVFLCSGLYFNLSRAGTKQWEN